MDNLLLYLFKISAATAMFYLCYLLFLSRDTFYFRNRIFLIGILVLSCIIPLMKEFSFFSTGSGIEQVNAINSVILSGTIIGASVSEKITSLDLNEVFVWFYFSITGLFLLRLITSITRTYLIIKGGSVRDPRFPKIVISDMELPPFSFFPYIVIPKKIFATGNYPEILDHEKAHIIQGHTFDLLLSELLITFLWFNPFIWLIKRAMVLNHEYLADKFSIKSSCSTKEYQYKLLNIPGGLLNVPLAHNFSSLIKNRIIMINKKPTRNYAMLKSIIILPAAAILFVMFSFRPETISLSNGPQEPLFSNTSKAEILKFLAINTGYPKEARAASDTGKIFVVVKMGKGGIIKDCKAVTEASEIRVPVLPEIVIVGYKSAAAQQSASKIAKVKGDEHPLLRAESLRIANKLGEVKITEWNDKDMEFAVAIKFILK